MLDPCLVWEVVSILFPAMKLATYFQPNMGSARIGDRSLSDHAFMSAEWTVIEDPPRVRLWHLTNILLDLREFEVLWLVWFAEFYSWNQSTATKTGVWDTCKAYLRARQSLLRHLEIRKEV